MEKPFAPACERNQEHILKVLKEIISPYNMRLLEIGAGTGQHAVFLAPHFPHIQWIVSDLKENHSGINLWINEKNISNIKGPIEFEVGKTEFPKTPFDAVFTANTFHIMSWKEDKTLMKIWGNRLREGSVVFIYGPLNYEGKFTSKSNEEFDAWLKEQNSQSGIRSFEDIKACMEKHNFKLLKDYEMPANNRMLTFVKN